MARYPNFRLTYFDNKGRAEHCRLLFVLAGVEYEDVRVDMKDWPKLKPDTPFGQLPTLEVQIDDNTSFTVCQSYAICRYLANTFGLMGRNDIDALNIDVIVDCQEDFNRPLIAFARDPNPVTKAEKKKKFIEEQQDVYLENFDKLLQKNNGKFFVGNSLTWADLAFYHGISFAKIFDMQTPWDKFPRLKAHKEYIENEPRIKEWFQARPVTQW